MLVSFCVYGFDEESDVALWLHFHIQALAYTELYMMS